MDFSDKDAKEIQQNLDDMYNTLQFISQQHHPALIEVDFIAEKAVEHWQKDGLDFFICENRVWGELQQFKYTDLSVGRWNGYVKFPKLPGETPGYRGIYTYLPVHGGITFFQEWTDGSVTYGFDTGHVWSKESPIDDLGWVRLETESMGRSIQIAARFEKYYLRAGDNNQKKARVLERMGKFLPVEVEGNFGIMLRLLSGEL
jgi:hypothetical protein